MRTRGVEVLSSGLWSLSTCRSEAFLISITIIVGEHSVLMRVNNLIRSSSH